MSRLENTENTALPPELYQQMQPKNVHVCESHARGLSGFAARSPESIAFDRPWLLATA